MENKRPSELRRLPKVDRLIESLGDGVPHPIAAEAARGAIDEARAAILSGAPAPDLEQLAARASMLIHLTELHRLTEVINATGVLLHTNLGRAPLAGEAVRSVARVSAGYSNLEYDLERGERGSRYDHAVQMLRTLTGAPAALVVNNNAAAVLLALAALARGREVVISRGELIEIGGGFRIPEILAESGAKLVEVGTTNRTHERDYERAVGPGTAAIMKVHTSNYRIVGFTASVPAAALVSLAHKQGIAFLHDLGSGLLRRRVAGHEPEWLRDEPSVDEALGEGADVVTFSGDKLLGGPQAGIVLGTRDAVERMHRLPLLRAVRVDKMTLAALEATLLAYLEGQEERLPFWSMALAPAAAIDSRAARLRAAIPKDDAETALAGGFSATGGGSAPGSAIPTVLVAIRPRWANADRVVRRLLDGSPPIVARIDDDQVIIDLRTVIREQDESVSTALAAALRP